MMEKRLEVSYPLNSGQYVSMISQNEGILTQDKGWIYKFNIKPNKSIEKVKLILEGNNY